MGTEFYIFLAVLGMLLVGVIIIFPFRALRNRRIRPDPSAPEKDHSKDPDQRVLK